ncbi:MAG: preprotein translocase subunit SecG [Paracoccus sp. (in: a-proteobacteria)]|uniref:preprotein translocase subunit SecG n=1 Tax=Paracoccus sp. TaxID=267 RepID=UPI0026E04D63|nr:preprotein translocase subunit SecG [Paracoccus sp. (in: a-proteobacteria)]MDO5611852.1 preprotein translocase subunit SecG [Paracoccus sp. (in: a-proteobacteria)]
MQNVVLTIHLILAVLLTGVVLLQRSEGGGLGMGGGGGGGGVMTGRQAANALTRLTWIFGIALFCTSVALTVIAARESSGGSVLDRFGGAGAPAPASGNLPQLPTYAPPPGAGQPVTPPAPDAAVTPAADAPAVVEPVALPAPVEGSATAPEVPPAPAN